MITDSVGFLRQQVVLVSFRKGTGPCGAFNSRELGVLDDPRRRPVSFLNDCFPISKTGQARSQGVLLAQLTTSRARPGFEILVSGQTSRSHRPLGSIQTPERIGQHGDEHPSDALPG